jgi:hypothetical protein
MYNTTIRYSKKTKTENNSKSCCLVNKWSCPRKELQSFGQTHYQKKKQRNRNLDPKAKLKEERHLGYLMIPTPAEFRSRACEPFAFGRQNTKRGSMRFPRKRC